MCPVQDVNHVSGLHLVQMARLARFERATAWFVARYSIQLSYRRVEGAYYRDQAVTSQGSLHRTGRQLQDEHSAHLCCHRRRKQPGGGSSGAITGQQTAGPGIFQERPFPDYQAAVHQQVPHAL